MADDLLNLLTLQVEFIGQHALALQSQTTTIKSQIANLEQLKQAGFPIEPLAEQLNYDLTEIKNSAQSLQNTNTTIKEQLGDLSNDGQMDMIKYQSAIYKTDQNTGTASEIMSTLDYQMEVINQQLAS